MGDNVLRVKIIPDVSELNKEMKKVATQKMEIATGKTSTGGGGMESLMGMAKSPQMLALVGGITAIVGYTKMINDRIETMNGLIKDASPAFKNTQAILDRIYGMVLKPMGDMMQMVMMPYVKLMMVRVRQGMKEAQPILKKMRTGEISEEEGIKTISGIYEKMATDSSYISKMMTEMIKPISSSMEGFKSATDLINNTFFKGMEEWVDGFVEGIKSNFSLGTMPDSTAKWLLETVESDPKLLQSVPDNIATDWINWIGTNFSKVDASDDLKKTVDSWLETINGEDAFKDVPLTSASLFLVWLKGGLDDTTHADGLMKDTALAYKDYLTDKTLETIGIAIFKGIPQAWYDFATDKQVQDAFVAILVSSADAIAETIKSYSFLNILRSVLGMGVGGAGEPIPHQAGAEISRDGVYMLHSGERVLNRSENNEYSRGGGMIMNPTINITVSRMESSTDIRMIADKISREIYSNMNMRS